MKKHAKCRVVVMEFGHMIAIIAYRVSVNKFDLPKELFTEMHSACHFTYV